VQILHRELTGWERAFGNRTTANFRPWIISSQLLLSLGFLFKETSAKTAAPVPLAPTHRLTAFSRPT